MNREVKVRFGEERGVKSPCLLDCMPFFYQTLRNVKNNFVPTKVCQKTKTSRKRVLGEFSTLKIYSMGVFSKMLLIVKYNMSVVKKASPSIMNKCTLLYLMLTMNLSVRIKVIIAPAPAVTIPPKAANHELNIVNTQITR